MSHIAFTYHLVFATYNRCPTIVQEHERELYNFIYRFLIKRDVFIRRIGGMPDHVHLLCDIPPKHAVADVMKLLKIESSKFMQKTTISLIGMDGRKVMADLQWMLLRAKSANNTS